MTSVHTTSTVVHDARSDCPRTPTLKHDAAMTVEDVPNAAKDLPSVRSADGRSFVATFSRRQGRRSLPRREVVHPRVRNRDVLAHSLRRPRHAARVVDVGLLTVGGGV